MSFSEDQFVSKLNTLEDTQESISNASKWLLSQYKEAPRAAECWKNYMLKRGVNTRRKLLAIYLTNHVVQQAKGKKIIQFQIAFGNVAAQVLRNVYPELPKDLKQKVKRVCDIWRDRAIFSDEVLNDIRASLKVEDSESATELSPPKLSELIKLHRDILKAEQSTNVMKLRFDKSIEALDPSSVVYEENLKTVTKIGQAATDTANKSMSYRKRCIENLTDLLKEQQTLLDNEENLIEEVNMILRSRDPSNFETTAQDDNILPTYEIGNDDDDEDDDGDKNSSSSSDEDTKNDENNAILAKREGEPPLNTADEPESKRLKSSSIEQSAELEEAYEPEAPVPSSNSDQGESTAVTSSIQDLLSKLAN
ncbi:hypothetical protein ZYGR_0BA00610 [Zygosaccharomyces rouxii]|uniref:CID domain-containing protein n=1 Tax=Zygosaccharomyces rouxii TaxID=4956 RepID=A0A1Q3AKH7_ZYGRO|nr:hypothetical protein ZYGR_0BA00610 [Zygosaccharomyces rouxii]